MRMLATSSVDAIVLFVTNVRPRTLHSAGTNSLVYMRFSLEILRDCLIKKCESYLNQRLNKFHFALSRVVGIHLKEIHEYDCFVSHWFTSVTVG